MDRLLAFAPLLVLHYVYTLCATNGISSKNVANQRKHGISFELAAQVFEDAYCLVGADRVDGERAELRWHAIGKAEIKSERCIVLLVVHIYREDEHGEEIIRIISARAAEKHEVRRYQEQANE
jgi:uncharacterized DUF497 family protein